jgi:hypothetical protein
MVCGKNRKHLQAITVAAGNLRAEFSQVFVMPSLFGIDKIGGFNLTQLVFVFAKFVALGSG